jgi:hypothetical protein
MSTKPIRDALALMKEIQGHSSAEIHAAAMEAVEAIEQAAETLAAADVSPLGHMQQDECDRAQALMETIAEENAS